MIATLRWSASYIATLKSFLRIKSQADRNHWTLTESFINKRRADISLEIDRQLGSVVKYGPFRGFKLTHDTWWGEHIRAGQLLGLYEQEVLQILENTQKHYRAFINIGAGDGYYGLGALMNKSFEKSYCYEISEKGRTTIVENAQINGLSDRVVVRGAAENDFFNDIPPEDLRSAIVVIDIEGGEFDLLDKSTFDALENAIIIVEIHEFEWFGDVKSKVGMMIENSKATHKASRIPMGARDLSEIPELHNYSDNDRWLVCSEGRPHQMYWIQFQPLSNGQRIQA